MSGRGAGLLGARGGWAERERTGGKREMGRGERERAGPPERVLGRHREKERGEGSGPGFGLGWDLGLS